MICTIMNRILKFSPGTMKISKTGPARLSTRHADRQHYTKGLPVFLSEYGGIKWAPDKKDNAWGYGDAPKTEAEFIDRYDRLTTALLDNPNMMGFCYTQLTDVEQECNGIYYYDRTPKFDVSIFPSHQHEKSSHRRLTVTSTSSGQYIRCLNNKGLK